MIIWGSKAKDHAIGGGAFFCPVCKNQTRYTHQRVSRYFTLYFIPLFPTSVLSEYVRCGGCQTALRPEVLRLAREQIEEATRPWACPSCGNRNAAEQKTCLACGKSRHSMPPALPNAAPPQPPNSAPSPPPVMAPAPTNIVQRGPDTHADLEISPEWIRNEQSVQVPFPDGSSFLLRVPRFARDGSQLRMKGKAPNGNGDLYLHLQIPGPPPPPVVAPPLTRITQRGPDTYADLNLSQEWITEERIIQVTIPGGRLLPIQLPYTTKDGHQYSIKGAGQGGKGDLYICFRIN